jgi:perosamine synthetase
MLPEPIPFARPWFGTEENERLAAVLHSGWVSQGAEVEAFEEAVADFTGAAYAVAVNSATSALTLALRLQGVGPGDEVICPSFTCMATVNAIFAVGGRPVFADIDAHTCNVDPTRVEEAVTARTRAILAVDQVGLPADWDDLADVARRHNLALIEDAACALGAEYRGRRVGGLGWPTALSFHPRKILTTGEGGMLLLADADMAARARRLRSHGAAIDDRARHESGGTLVTAYPEPGYNFRMTDLQGALGVAQVKRVPWFLEERRRQASNYDAALARFAHVQTPVAPADRQHVYQSYLLRLRGRLRPRRDEIVAGLVARGIACRPGIAPLHLEPFFRGEARSLPVTEAVARDSLFLPIFPGLVPSEQQRVIEAVTELVTGPAWHGKRGRRVVAGESR